ncbi:MAG TPA: pyridoxamine 5'-phosphate oxidase [Mycobacteriales bacterium]|nr:pyridoxamine 5'-phosphate oxidase [Mycobacteriales bacterium]
MSHHVDLATLRRDYQAAGLSAAGLPAEPVDLWQAWLADATEADLPEVNAMVVSTVDPDGAPSSRTVLCKGADREGFVFYTNYESRKGIAIAHEARVSLLFPWHALARQVIVSGRAARLSREESTAYFASRPRGAQVSALASAQSSVIGSRDVLDERVAEISARYAGSDVPCPPNWGGYRVRPDTVEFWQGRHDRLHDRLRYACDRDGWRIERLSP